MTSSEGRPPAADPTSVLARASTLLGAFRPGDASLRLAEIHRRTGMPKPTAHRLLGQLVALGLVDRDDGGGYRLGMRLFELGQLVPGQHGIEDRVAPVLSGLHAATGLTVHLAVLDRTEVVYLHKVSAPGAPPLASRVGGRLPAHPTAVGKAVLAHSPAPLTRAVLDGGLRRLSPRTVVAPTLFLGQLDAVREHGYAREDEESAVGVSCVAAPIFDRGRRAVAAVSVTARTHDVRSTASVHAVRQAAAEATRLLRAA
ncbi:IclR family transcriptional regulator [Actinomycetospora chlora]|uniref:IclR family transcriptional regulator n=1 Tax=Actinomycetospora chlora TaxID=663608 RepID=A0ABP9C3Q9_9PSEU